MIAASLQLVVAKRAVRGGPGRIFIGPGYRNMIRNRPVWLGGPVRFRAEFVRISSWTDSRVHELKRFIFILFLIFCFIFKFI